MNLWSTAGVIRDDVDEPPGSAPSSLISPEIHSILYYGSLAPSGHNTQPWSVRLGKGEMWIGTERSRWRPKSEDERVPALIDAGRRCERMWLATRERSIAVHTMSQVLEESPLMEQIARDLGLTGPVQFILRVGYVTAYPDPVSLRMPVSWFLKT